MEDLDSLLEDLARGKSSTNSNGNSTVKKVTNSRPVSSRVDLNELEDLMEDLAAPTAKQTPQPMPATSARVSMATVEVNTVPATTAPAPAEPQSTSTGNNMDDLEALMESLNMVSNKRVSRRESVPVTTTTTTTAAVYTPPVSQPVTQPVVQPVSPPAQSPNNRAPSGFYGNASPTPANNRDSTLFNNNSNSNSFNNNVSNRNTVQMGGNTTTATTGPVKGDDLDKLLSNLTTQMTHIDTDNPSSRGTCWTCKGSIMGEIIQALGRTYHPEHFTCGNCRDPLGTRNFYEQNGNAICQNCYQLLYCPKCGHCDQPIADRCITAMGKKWHPEHFICAQCLKPFPNGNFFEREGRPYCEADFFGLYAPKCGACQEPIKGDCISALGQQWHPEHFVCTYCGRAFSGTFFEHNGKPYCEAHYHQQTGSLCGGCGKSITGRCVNALDKKWHPEHFVCAFCMNPLAGGSFSEKNNKAYCKECHTKLFGN